MQLLARLLLPVEPDGEDAEREPQRAPDGADERRDEPRLLDEALHQPARRAVSCCQGR